jgi:hypothetical protein
VIFSFDPRRAAPSAPHFAQFWCNISPFRINTSKSVSKQTTLTPFRMNTYEKHGGGGGGIFRLRRNPTIDLPAPCRDFSASFPQHSNMQTFKHYNFRFSVHSSKFRIPQLLCLPLLRKHRGVYLNNSHSGTLPSPLATHHSPLLAGYSSHFGTRPCAPNGSLYFPLCPVRDSQSASPTI